jgi:carbon storage regulator
MLVLTRKLGEKITIGEHIEITVIEIDRYKVRLGITAPRDIPIFRKELLDIQRPLPGEAAGPVE